MNWWCVRALVAAGLWLPAAAPARASDDLATLLVQVAAGPGRDRDHAIERLKFLGPATAGPPLCTLLAAGDARARVGASAALAVLADPGSVAALEHAIGDEDWEVRRNAAGALGALGKKSSARRLAHALLTDANARVRKACALALAVVGGGGPALARAAAKDHDLEVRLASLDALARQMDRSSLSAVRPLLADGSGLVRFAAARALAWAGDGGGKAFLARAVDSGDEDQQRRAVTVLADCPKRWALDLLAKATLAPPVALPAASALAARADRRGMRALARLALSGEGDAAAASRQLDLLGFSAAQRAALAAEREQP